MIYCPKCEGETVVRDSNGTNRRRKCKACDFRFSTREMLIEDIPKAMSTVTVSAELYESFAQVFNQMRKRTLLQSWGVKPLKGNN